MLSLEGLYESSYTMRDDGELLVVSDRINFGCHDGLFWGRGEEDTMNLTMHLLLRVKATSLIGDWQEVSKDGENKSEGCVQLVADGAGRFAGHWWEINTVDEDSWGTWFLVQARM